MLGSMMMIRRMIYSLMSRCGNRSIHFPLLFEKTERKMKKMKRRRRKRRLWGA